MVRSAQIFIFISIFIVHSEPKSSFIDETVIEKPTWLNGDDFRWSDRSSNFQEPLDLEKTLRDDLLEGDIQGLTTQTLDDFVKTHNVYGDDAGIQQSAIRNKYNRWPLKTIPYLVSSRYTRSARAMIAKAFLNFHTKTCLKFVPRKDQRDYIYIMPDDGCYSSIGRVGGGQIVSLTDGCWQHGTIIHELMHAVGFFHEQNRNDRDFYIQVLNGNIKYGLQGNFEKRSLAVIDHLNTAYDYGSVMHYGAYYFSRNGRPTIVAKYPGVTMGQRNGFSTTDLIRINKLYQCSDTSGYTSTIGPTTSIIAKLKTPTPITTNPWPTTSASHITTQKPDTTRAIHTTTQKPDTTTAIQSTTQKPDTTRAIHTTTQKPDTTTAIHSTTQKPDTTRAIHTTTQKPDITTAIHSTTQKPDTTRAIHTTTQKPDITTAIHSTTQKPDTTRAIHTTTQKPTGAIHTTTQKPDTTRGSHTTTQKPEPGSCSSSRDFRCKEDKKCIRETAYCDGKKDCIDGSDEPVKCILCNKDQFICQRILDCIHRNLVCNGRADCADGTDEINCD